MKETTEFVINANDIPWTQGPTGLSWKTLVDFPNGPKMRLVRIEPGEVVPRHQHPRANEITYILEGELEMDNTVYGPGTCYYKPHGGFTAR